MKVYISNYKRFFGSYQLVELLRFVGVPERFREKLFDYLSETWIHSFLEWIDNKGHKRLQKGRKVRVKIDEEDLFSLDHTLSFIILPALIKLKESDKGIPYTKNEDVPEEFRTNDETSFNGMEKRWDYILGEMIYSFEQIVHFPDRAYSDERVKNGLILFGKYYRSLWT